MPDSPAPPSVRPSLRQAPAEVTHAYLIAQEARLNVALQQAANPRAMSLRLGSPTVSRLIQAAAGLTGAGTPNPTAQAMIARALDAAYQIDAQATGPEGGARLVAELLLKGVLGRARGEALSSLAFLGHHPRLTGPNADPSALASDPVLRRHGANVAGAVRLLADVGAYLNASPDPAIRARAHRVDDALRQLYDHPRWGPAVRLAARMNADTPTLLDGPLPDVPTP